MTWETALTTCLLVVVGCACLRWVTAGVRDAVVTVVAVKAKSEGGSPIQSFLRMLDGGDEPKAKSEPKGEREEVKS